MTVVTPEPRTIEHNLPCPGFHSYVIPSVTNHTSNDRYTQHGTYISVALLRPGAPHYIRGYAIAVRSPHIITGGKVVAPQSKGYRSGGMSN